MQSKITLAWNVVSIKTLNDIEYFISYYWSKMIFLHQLQLFRKEFRDRTEVDTFFLNLHMSITKYQTKNMNFSLHNSNPKLFFRCHKVPVSFSHMLFQIILAGKFFCTMFARIGDAFMLFHVILQLLTI